MLCPKCPDLNLRSRDTPYGVIVDFCADCKGIWLDHNEITYFAKEKELLNYYLQKGLINPSMTKLSCPSCSEKMQRGGLISKELQIDECVECKGLWFDTGELKKFRELTASMTQRQNNLMIHASKKPEVDFADDSEKVSHDKSSTGLRYLLRQNAFPSVDVWIDRHHKVFTESGGMSWMQGSVEMETGLQGGLLKSIGRKLAGESLFLITYSVESGTGRVTFSSEFPGSILPVDMSKRQPIIIQKDAFLVAESTVELSMQFQKRLWAGLFGGEGFILQRAEGKGMLFLEITGDLIEYELSPGEVLKVDPGHVAAFEASVDFDLQWIKGVMNKLFSGEGLFLATLCGPGRVWLQSMTMPDLAAKVSSYLPQYPTRRGKASQSIGSNVIDAIFSR